jgi:hypothetical protein
MALHITSFSKYLLDAYLAPDLVMLTVQHEWSPRSIHSLSILKMCTRERQALTDFVVQNPV